GEQDIAFDVFRLHPSVLDSLRFAYPRLVGGSAEFGHHSGRGLDVDHLAAAACHRQRVAARTAADINEDVIRTEKRRYLLEERVEFAPGVGPKAGGDGAPGVGLRAAGALVLSLAGGDHLVVLASR